jgi:hypothetical protein
MLHPYRSGRIRAGVNCLAASKMPRLRLSPGGGHSTASSARAISGSGIVRPGTLAVLAAPQSLVRFARRFLLIPIDREAPSYQPLDLSLAVRLVFFLLAVADVLSFGARTTVRPFLPSR